jgi:hypothetical protein
MKLERRKVDPTYDRTIYLTSLKTRPDCWADASIAIVLTLRRQSIVLLLLLLLTGVSNAVQKPDSTTASDTGINSLEEVRDKRNALLVVFRSRILEAGNRERAIIEDVLKADPEPRGSYRSVYGQIAKKLNSYIRKYRSLSPAQRLRDADYVIFFNIVEYRQVLNATYPYGELFVIVKGSPETQLPPRVVWKAKKILWAGDAINDFIKDLKTLRGES